MKKYALIAIWSVWAAAVTVTGRWPDIVDSWFVAPTMLLGSFIAGATAEGGGAVAFPVLTLVFQVDPQVARDFSLMIQSVGMTAASFTIVVMRQKVEWRSICCASCGGFFGVVLGIDVVSPLLSPAYTKMFFVSFWLAFAVVLFFINRLHDRNVNEQVRDFGVWHAVLLMLIGIVGGTVSGVTGCGLDITTFSLIVLGFNVSEDVATRSSVIMMAAASVFGFAYKGVTAGMAPDAWNYWIVAVPVVVLGAPLGAWFIRNKSRHLIANILYISIAAQFLTAIVVIQQSFALLAFSAAALTMGLIIFGGLAQYGRFITSRALAADGNEPASQLATR